MTRKGIQLSVTQNGKIHFVAQDGEDSVSFVLTPEMARELQAEYQSVLSKVDPQQDNGGNDE
jgi:hypothetical protein